MALKHSSPVKSFKVTRNLHEAQHDGEDEYSRSDDLGSDNFLPGLLLALTSSHLLGAVDAVPGPGDDIVVGRRCGQAVQVWG